MTQAVAFVALLGAALALETLFLLTLERLMGRSDEGEGE